MGQSILALVPDAFGGRGGIALYNRHLLKAVSRSPTVDEVVALPRNITDEPEGIPQNVQYLRRVAGGKFRYALGTATLALRHARVDLILCTHLHLLPFAHFLRAKFKCPILPVVYGVEAWRPTPHGIANRQARKIKAFIAIRRLTAARLANWAEIPDAKVYYLPNCIDASSYGVAPKRSDLVEKYDLQDKRVVMTAGRLDAFEFDRRKGFDEVLEVLPQLRAEAPDVAYLVMGDGADRPRLEEKSRALGVADIVTFTGYVPEAEKADHYRLADVFAMPGSSPIFDRYPFRFVFLEALACGVPVVGCRLEDASEANDLDAKKLIIQVDPSDPEEIRRGILKGLSMDNRTINPTLAKFRCESFEKNVVAILEDVIGGRTG